MDDDRMVYNHWILRLPACHSISVSAGLGAKVLLMATNDRLPLSHPTKMEEPQTAVSPLLGLISVAY